MRENRNSATSSANPEKLAELQSLVLHLPNLTGTFYPLDKTNTFPVGEPLPSKLPVPPQSLWHDYGKTEEEYLNGGRHHAKRFYDAYKKHRPPLTSGQRMLDFGCSGGRVVRFFEPEARAGVEVWGCDIDAASINWCQKNLMPPLKFFTNTTQPALPLPNGHFDFIYAGSVFSHINEMAAAWLLELSRVTAKGGVCVFTVNTELAWDHFLQDIKTDPNHHRARTIRYLESQGVSREGILREGHQSCLSSPWWAVAWYSREYFTRIASLGFDVIDVVPSIYGAQTGMVLRAR